MSTTNDAYRVQLDVYNGPLDLLLYLVRRDEVDIYDIQIARLTAQYITYVDVLQEIDPNVAGEFLVMAATLMEIKSRTLLPTPPPTDDDEFVDPRLELVKQLLEYKRFKDAAESLHEAALQRSQRFERRPALPEEETEGMDLEDAQIWDLLVAFQELMAQIGRKPTTHDVIYDDTPIALHAADLTDRLERAGGSLEFASIFVGLAKIEMIGLFLALLELIRQKRVRGEQGGQFGTITVHLLDEPPQAEGSFEEFSAEADESEPTAAAPSTEEEEPVPLAAIVDVESDAEPSPALERDATSPERGGPSIDE